MNEVVDYGYQYYYTMILFISSPSFFIWGWDNNMQLSVETSFDVTHIFQHFFQYVLDNIYVNSVDKPLTTPLQMMLAICKVYPLLPCYFPHSSFT